MGQKSFLTECHSGLNRFIVMTGTRPDFKFYDKEPYVLTLVELQKMFKEKITASDFKHFRIWYFPEYNNQQILEICLKNLQKFLQGNKDTLMEKIVLEGCIATIDYVYRYAEGRKRNAFIKHP